VADGLPGALTRMVALWNGDPVDPNDIFVRGCVMNGGATYDPEDVLPWIQALRTAFADLVFEVVDHVQAGARHAVCFRAHGTHTGPFATSIGIAQPTGKPIEAHGIEIFDLHSDRVVAVREAWDWRDIYATLGARLGD